MKKGVLLLLLLVSCSGNKPTSVPVSSVDDAQLNPDQLKAKKLVKMVSEDQFHFDESRLAQDRSPTGGLHIKATFDPTSGYDPIILEIPPTHPDFELSKTHPDHQILKADFYLDDQDKFIEPNSKYGYMKYIRIHF